MIIDTEELGQNVERKLANECQSRWCWCEALSSKIFSRFTDRDPKQDLRSYWLETPVF